MNLSSLAVPALLSLASLLASQLAFAQTYEYRKVVPRLSVGSSAGLPQPPATETPIALDFSKVSVDRNSLSFPETNEGTTADLQLKVTNANSSSIQLSIERSGTSYAAFDVVSTGTCALTNGKLTVPGAQSCDLTVQFSPLSPYYHTASLGLRSASPAGLLTVALSGQAVEVDPLWDDVTLLAAFDGAAGSTQFLNSKSNTTGTRIGSAVVTDQARFGSGALSVSGGSAVGFGTGVLTSGQFTIETWLMLKGTVSSQNSMIFDSRIPGYTSGVQISKPSAVISYDQHPTTPRRVQFGGLYGTTVIQLDTWYHVALTRDASGYGRIYVNGTLEAQGTTVVYEDLAAGPFIIGKRYQSDGASVTPFNGYFDDFRVTNGVVRYTGNFTPPDRALPGR